VSGQKGQNSLIGTLLVLIAGQSWNSSQPEPKRCDNRESRAY
jgi:hypothetical protein